MLTVVSIMGDMGTCEAPNMDHENGALFNPDGTPAYCQIMSMHWGVNDRETVECDGGECPATQAECSGETFTYHGHEVVAEVRRFLEHATHFFAECQAVNAYENTVPNPAWPYLDDEGRYGHFLTTEGMPPDCPCDAGGGDYECVPNGCDGGTRDCCLPSDIKERGAGFMIADQPVSDTLQILNPGIPYNQLDGAYGTVGGSEPAYNLSEFLGTEYKNDLDVTFITGPMGPGDQDVWMTGFVDGECDIIGYDEFTTPGMECDLGKVSYLGGHRYETAVPVSGSWGSQGTRLFLNALFEADCVTGGPVTMDRDGDGIPDTTDPFPDDRFRCGDSDMDGCDDCTSGTFNTATDCTAPGVDGGGTGGADGGGTGPGDEGGCGCRVAGGGSSGPIAVVLVFAIATSAAWRTRRRKKG
jgi:MYXO-CTERM domain-containing protein